MFSPFTSRRRRQTAPQGASESERVSVTFPVHPLRGMSLAVVRIVRHHSGQQYVDVEHPKGGFIRLPLEWTDRRAPVVEPVAGGQQVRLDALALLKLAEAVEEVLGRALSSEPTAVGGQKPRFHHASAADAQSGGALAAPVGGGKGAVAGSLGQPAAQDAARRGRSRGGSS
jgi:hypothetical protein